MDRRSLRRAAAGLAFRPAAAGYKGRFEAEKAFQLIEKYGVKNLPLPDGAEDDDEGHAGSEGPLRPRPAFHHELPGEPVGETVYQWAKEKLGVTVNEMFGQTEMNYVIGNCGALWEPRPGRHGAGLSLVMRWR